MTKIAARMLRLMDRTVEEWYFPVIGREKGRVLRRLLAQHRPRRGVEIGSLFGYSAILIAASLPRGGTLTCIEQNPFMAMIVEENARHAGLGARVTVVTGDALRVLPRFRGRVDFVFIDAEKDEYLRYLRAMEPRLTTGALVVADNTGISRREVRPYLAHVRGAAYESHEHDFGSDCMEVSVYRG